MKFGRDGFRFFEMENNYISIVIDFTEWAFLFNVSCTVGGNSIRILCFDIIFWKKNFRNRH